MRIPTANELRMLFKGRHARRGYYDFVKMTLGVMASVLVLLVFLSNALERFELTTYDYRMKFRKKREVNEKIVLVDMGEDSVKRIGRWPWPREWHATMITVLSRYGAEAVVFDVIFSERSGELGDGAMEEAMASSGRVYIPYAVEFDRFDKEKREWNIWNIISPLDNLSKRSKGEGHITLVPDQDGIIRSIPLIVEHEGRVFPQLGLKVACDILGLDVMKYKIIKTPLSRYIKIGDKKENALYIPVDERNQILVNWAAPWGKAFKHYSYIDTITSYERVLSKNTPHIILEGFKDKICIIGLTAPGLHDIKPNVLQPAYPAVGTNANIINSILNRDFIRKAPRWLDSFLILFMGIFLSMNITKVKPIRGASIAVLMLAAYTLMSFTILDSMGLWVVLIHPLAAILLSYLVITFYNQIVIAIEQSKLYTLATKDGLTGLFVVRHFNLLLEAEINMIESRGGELAILMIDVDHFKEINDRYGHQAGDFILKGVADIVISYCRQLDVPSRYGGEEFIMMLPGAALSDAATVAERMRRRIEGNSFRRGNIEYRVTISVGVASFKEKDTKDDLIKKADKALYEAKEGGRNKVCLERS